MPDISYKLRAAREEDAKTIRKLVIQGGINPTGLKWTRFVVAEAPSGEVIACGQVKPHRDGTRELASIVVRPDWRGRGVARAIIEHLLEQHPGELYLMCRSALGPLYEKFGFQPVADDEMPRYFRRVKGLARLAEWLMREGEYLLVMRREGEKNFRGSLSRRERP